jgi:hypothetical protein
MKIINMYCVLYRVLFKRKIEHCITSGIVGRCATVTSFTQRRTKTLKRTHYI